MYLIIHYRIYLFALFIMLLLSCGEQQNPEFSSTLARAEAIMHNHPDSALLLLQEMPVPPHANKTQHATWCLLMSQARNKNQLPVSDSLLNIAAGYFETCDNPQRKALLWYLQGDIHADNHETIESMNCYLKSAGEIEKTEDYTLAYLIYLRIGDIYNYRRLPDYAEENIRKSLHYARLSENYTNISYALIYLARMYSVRADWDEAIECYQQAVNASKISGDQDSLGSALHEISVMYCRKRDYDTALEYLMKSMKVKRENNIIMHHSFLRLGEIYRLQNRTDSAQLYFEKATEATGLYTRLAAYQGLYYLNKNIRNYPAAIQYSDSLWFYQDTIRNMEHTRAVLEMQEKYKHEKILNEKNLLKIQKDKLAKNTLAGAIFILTLLTVIIFLYQNKLIRRQKTIRKNEEQLQDFSMRLRENQSVIINNECHIQELIASLEQNKDELESMREQQNAIEGMKEENEMLKAENEKLMQNISQTSRLIQKEPGGVNVFGTLSGEVQRLRAREKFLTSQLIKATEVLDNLRQHPHFLSIAQWEDVKSAINWLFDDFTERLLADIPTLNESDIQICCLMKLHLQVAEIATLLGISPASVSKRKLRLKERIMSEGGRPWTKSQSFDVWLWEY